MLTLLAVAMGVVADLLLWGLRASPERPGRLRLFAALLPAGIYTVYFLELLASRGVWWPVHLWTGAIMLAAAEGWLISYLVLPPGGAAHPGQV